MIALLWPPEHSTGDHFVVSLSVSAFSNFRRRTPNDLATLESSNWAFVRFRSAVGSNYSPPSWRNTFSDMGYGMKGRWLSENR